MAIESIMRRRATGRARWLYALDRIFANIASTDVRLYEQRRVTDAVAAFAVSGKSVVSRFAGRYDRWRRRMRSRRELAMFGDVELADLCLSRSDARTEANKWFWQT